MNRGIEVLQTCALPLGHGAEYLKCLNALILYNKENVLSRGFCYFILAFFRYSNFFRCFARDTYRIYVTFSVAIYRILHLIHYIILTLTIMCDKIGSYEIFWRVQ